MGSTGGADEPGVSDRKQTYSINKLKYHIADGLYGKSGLILGCRVFLSVSC